MTLVRTKWNFGNSMRNEKENNRILRKCCLKKLVIGSSLVGDFKEVPLGLSHLWPLTTIGWWRVWARTQKSRTMALAPLVTDFLPLGKIPDSALPPSWVAGEVKWENLQAQTFPFFSSSGLHFPFRCGCDFYAGSFTVCRGRAAVTASPLLLLESRCPVSTLNIPIRADAYFRMLFTARR